MYGAPPSGMHMHVAQFPRAIHHYSPPVATVAHYGSLIPHHTFVHHHGPTIHLPGYGAHAATSQYFPQQIPHSQASPGPQNTFRPTLPAMPQAHTWQPVAVGGHVGVPAMPPPPQQPEPLCLPTRNVQHHHAVGTVTVSGCRDAKVGNTVQGVFEAYSENHGRTVWKKQSQVNGLDVLIYFWDKRDGPSLNGWWIAPKIGGDAVWAYNPDLGTLPPTAGWKVPYDGEVDTTFSVSHHRETRKRRSETDSEKPLMEAKIARLRQQALQAMQESREKHTREQEEQALKDEADRKKANLESQTTQLEESTAELNAALATATALVEFAEKSPAEELESAMQDARGVLASLQALLDGFDVLTLEFDLRATAEKQKMELQTRLDALSKRLDHAARAATT